MSDVPLRTQIKELLASHPSISVSNFGHATHAERYVAKNGAPIGFEPERKRFQNIWVRADSVDMTSLKNIENELYFKVNFAVSKPNHNLFGEPAFKDVDLICFKVTTLWQAVRVILEAAGKGA